ncbi:MAG: hypothetical protein EA403_08210 [Spirochaetaceae bacterium]|nr:MAG: hypothetical protein EA403_08210 [Spirochaetaceae bacterium]
MREVSGRLALSPAAPELTERLREIPAEGPNAARRFTQNEEFFFELDRPFDVLPIPIHHPVEKLEPSPHYLDAVGNLIDQTASSLAGALHGLDCAFDPMHASWVFFFGLLAEAERPTLLLVTVDMAYRPLEHEVITRGSNDIAPRYRTNRIYLTVDFVPLRDAETTDGTLRVGMERSISQTWIGETGRGYVTQGIWIDRELNRFFTRLFLPQGARIYPWFPLHARYRCLCHSPLDISASARQNALDTLHDARTIILPRMDEILEELKAQPFSDELPIFQEMRRQVTPHEEWSRIRMRPYLNAQNMKEYVVEAK